MSGIKSKLRWFRSSKVSLNQVTGINSYHCVEYVKDTLENTFDLLFATLQGFHEANESARQVLEQGVKDIEAEETKHGASGRVSCIPSFLRRISGGLRVVYTC